MGTLQWGISGTISGLQNNQQGNGIAAALATANQGGAAPTPSSTGLAATSGLIWHDTANNLLKLRDQADAAWMTMAAVDETNKVVVSQHGGCRFLFGSATSVALKPYNGNGIKINGAFYSIPPAGVASGNTGAFVSGVAGTSLAASTAYLVYLFNNAGAPALDFWPLSGGHVTDGSAGNVGVEVRNNAGSPDSTRTLIGAVVTNASGQFVDNTSTQGVASWFNRRRRSVTSGAFTSSTTSNPPVALANSTVAVFVWGDAPEIDASFTGFATIATPSFEAITLIGLNGVGQGSGTANDMANSPNQYNMSLGQAIVPNAEGQFGIQTMGSTGGSTVTWQGTTFAITAI